MTSYRLQQELVMFPWEIETEVKARSALPCKTARPGVEKSAVLAIPDQGKREESPSGRKDQGKLFVCYESPLPTFFPFFYCVLTFL